jgi:hypothetical protein
MAEACQAQCRCTGAATPAHDDTGHALVSASAATSRLAAISQDGWPVHRANNHDHRGGSCRNGGESVFTRRGRVVVLLGGG